MNDTKRYYAHFVDSGNCDIALHEVYASNIAIALEKAAKIYRNVLTNSEKKETEKVLVYFA